MTGTDPITAIIDQLAAHAEQLTRLDTREADHHAAASSRLAELTEPGRRPRPGNSGARCRPRPPHRTQPDRPRHRRLLPRASAGVVEADRRGPAGTGRPAAGLGRAGIPARLRAPGRWPGPLLARPRPVPVRARHPGRTVVGAVPAARPQPRTGLRPGRIPGPHPARPGRTSSAPRPTAAATPATPHQPPASPGACHDRREAPPGPGIRGPRLAGVPLQRRPEDPRHPHGHRDATTDPEQITTWFTRNPLLEPRHRHRRTRTRRPGRRRARPGRERVRRVRHAVQGWPGRRRGRVRAHAQRRPARLLPRLRPAQRPPARPPPGLPLPRRLRPGPAIPGRRQALPAHPHRGRRRRTGLGHRHRPAGTPAEDRPAPAAPRPRPGPEPPGPVGRSQAEGNRNAGLFWAANRALDADPAADLSPLAAAARQAGLGEREIARTLESARKTGQARPPAPDYQAEAGDPS